MNWHTRKHFHQNLQGSNLWIHNVVIEFCSNTYHFWYTSGIIINHRMNQFNNLCIFFIIMVHMGHKWNHRPANLLVDGYYLQNTIIYFKRGHLVQLLMKVTENHMILFTSWYLLNAVVWWWTIKANFVGKVSIPVEKEI